MSLSFENDKNTVVSLLDETGITDGLIAYYNCDNLSILDNSGNNNNGTNYGATLATGLCGNAFSFNGSSYVSSNIDLGNAFTISLWFNPSLLGTSQMLFSSNSGRPYIYFVSDSIMVAWFLSDGVTSTNMNTYSTVLITQTNTWYHVLFTHTGTVAKVYFNGNLENTNPTTTLNTSSGLLRYIGRHSSPSFYFSGLIDEVKVYNRALTETEVKQLYKLHAINNIASMKEE